MTFCTFLQTPPYTSIHTSILRPRLANTHPPLPPRRGCCPFTGSWFAAPPLGNEKSAPSPWLSPRGGEAPPGDGTAHRSHRTPPQCSEGAGWSGEVSRGRRYTSSSFLTIQSTHTLFLGLAIVVNNKLVEGREARIQKVGASGIAERSRGARTTRNRTRVGVCGHGECKAFIQKRGESRSKSFSSPPGSTRNGKSYAK